MNTQSTQSAMKAKLTSACNKFLVVLLSVAMTFSGTTFGYAFDAEDAAAEVTTQNAAENEEVATQSEDGEVAGAAAEAEKAAPAASETVAVTDADEGEGTATVDLYIEHAYFTYGGQTVAYPSSSITVPANKDFTFTPAPDTGYTVEGITLGANGQEKKLGINDDGSCTIPAASVNGEIYLSIETAASDDAEANKALALENATKVDYSYEDGNVRVAATLSDPTAVPDDAQFVVTPVTADTKGYNYKVYMKALNDSTAEDAEGYTSENTLLYDVAFMVQKEDADGNAIAGQYEEFEPAAGSVKIDFSFKGQQLSEGIEADKAGDVEVKHLPLTEAVRGEVDSTEAATNISTDDVDVEDVSADVALASDKAEFSVTSLSVFSFKNNGEGQKNTWAGTKDFSIGDITNTLSDALNYAVYANEMDMHLHLEGNVKVGTLNVGTSEQLNQDSAVIGRNQVKQIDVTKTLAEAEEKDKAFSFGAYYASDNSLIDKFEITVPAGETSAKLELTSSNYSRILTAVSAKDIVIYELDKNGNPVEDKGTVDSTYTVTYKDNTVKTIANDANFTNMIGTVSKLGGGNSLQIGQGTFFAGQTKAVTYIENFTNVKVADPNKKTLFFTSGNTDVQVDNYGDVEGASAPELKADTLKYIKQQDGITAEIAGNLGKGGTYYQFSSELANAKNGAKQGAGSLSVINLISTTGSLNGDLDAANFYDAQNGNAVSGTIKEGGYLLINIDLTGKSTYALDKMKIDGYDEGTENEEIARHIIYNLVEKQGDSYVPYDGDVTINNIAVGTILAPAATVHNSRQNGAVIANKYDFSGSELHKDTLTRQTTASVSITNTKQGYEAEGELELKGTKTFENGDLSKQEFTFQVKDQDGKVVSTGKSGADGNIAFTPIEYTQDDLGEHIYTVTEVAGKAGGVTYSTKSYAVKVKVEDTDHNGKLTVTPLDGSADIEKLDFTNTYDAKGVLALKGTKTFENGSLAKQSFSFSVKDKDGKVVSTGKTDDKGAIDFSNIEYDLSEVGVYSYTVAEDIPSGAVKNEDGSYTKDGVTYSNKSYLINVQVSDNGDGTLKVERKDQNGATLSFANSYAAKGELTLTATKELFSNSGNKMTLEAGAYNFVVKEGNKEVATGTNDAQGNIAFSAIAYTKAGKHTYTVSEKAGPDKQTSYDKTSHTVEVNVVDNGKGELTANITSIKKGDEAVAGMGFTNTYTYGQASVQLKATKAVEGTWEDGDAFDIQLIDGEGKVLQTKTAKKDAATVSFDKLTYTKEGTYTYTIAEDISKLPEGVTAKVAEHGVKVVVSEDAQTGKLKSEVFVDDVASDGAVTITNAYSTTDAEAALVAKKSFKNGKLEAGAFTFQVKENGEVVATGTNDAEGNVSFGTFTYNKEGKHEYTISEVLPEGEAKLGYVSYDSSEYKATVDVTKEGNKLVAKLTYANGDAPTFTNTYSAAGSFVLQGVKTLKGAELAGKDFSFSVKDESGKVVSTGTSTADGSINFSEIGYTLKDAGEHSYTVTEDVPEAATKNEDGSYTLNGITYSTVSYKIVVKVTDNGDGTLKVERTDDQSEVLPFTNTYAAKGSLALEGEKSLVSNSGTNMELTAGAYSFVVKEGDKEVATGTNDAQGKVTFSAIDYTAAGDHTYTVTEQAGDDAQTSYDKASYTVKVSVTDDGNGNLSAKVESVTKGGTAASVSFTNTYAYSETSVSLKAQKLVEGSWEDGDEFSIQLKDGEGKVLQTKKVTKDAATVSFDKLTFTKAGTYNYTIEEDTSKLPEGVVAKVYKHGVEVKVTEGEGGKLESEVFVDGKASDGAVTITNTYSTSAATAQLRATKSYNGKLEAGMFAFQVKDQGGEVVATGTNDANGNVSFGTFTYDAEGTYEYTVSEVVPADKLSYVSYDSAEHKATVTVTKNGNKLEAKVEYEKGEEPAFTNTYSAKGSFKLEGVKTFEGASLAEKTFGFSVKDESGKVVSTGKSAADGSINFKAIDYTLEDAGKTFNYSVSEDVPEGAKENADGAYTLDGITYSNASYQISVKVTDNGDGTLSAERTDAASAVVSFTNSYAAAGSFKLEGTKKLVSNNGTSMSLSGHSFDFELKDEAGNAVATAKSDSKGAISFGSVAVKAAGTYSYTVSEKAGSEDGMSYDNAVYTVVVKATDKGDGTLATEIASITKNGENAAGIDFTNTYTYGAASVKLAATKKVVGSWEEGDEFAIQLKDAEGNVIQTKTATESGPTVHFDALSYTKPGSYSYQIVEDTSKLPEGVTSKTGAYSIVVDVTENAETGKLSAKVKVNGIDSTGEPVVVTNEYATGAATAQLSAKKAFEGASQLPAGAFSFQVKEGNEVISTASNDANGNVSFGAMTYTEEGEHTYTISEAEPSQKLDYVSYDSAEHKATVKVTKEGNKLVAKLTYKDGEAPTFTNGYSAKGGFTLEGVKTLEGADIAGHSFGFTVKEGSTVVATGKSDENGKIAFSEIAYTLADLGEHTYTVTEDVPEGATQNEDGGYTLDGITYAGTSQTVTVKVSDNGDGTLSAERVDENAGTLNFVNRYAATGEATFEGTKELIAAGTKNKMSLGERVFNFVVTDEAGNVVAQGTNDAEGNITFDKGVSFNAAGRYTYTVSEVAGDDAAISYSNVKYAVVVDVVDNGDGTLSATQSIVKDAVNGTADASAIVFTNSYDAKAQLELAGVKTFDNGTLADGQFSFTVTEKGTGEVVSTGSAKADGTIEYAPISYTLEDLGEHSYTVSEDIPADAVQNEDGSYSLDGVTYTAATREFAVNVSDNGDGTLKTEVTEGDAQKLSFANSYFKASAGLSFTKYFYGEAGSFEFTLKAATEDGAARAADANNELGLDANGQMHAIVSDFTDAQASVNFDAITYTKAGTYCYTVAENAAMDENGSVAMDSTVYLVKVEVGEKGATSVEAKVFGTDDAFAPIEATQAEDGTTEAVAGEFYNNETVTLSGAFFAMGAYNNGAAGVIVDPTAQKKLVDADGNEIALVGDEFSFQLIDESGEVVETVQNAADGGVAFTELAFSKAGTYKYQVRELAGNNSSISYDSTVFDLTVTVTEGEDGKLAATPVYSGGTLSAEGFPVFTNVRTKEGYDLKVQKVSRYGGEGLADCTYALWMVTPTGDVKVAEATSDETGWIYFKNVDLLTDVKYYYKEVKAPAGHTVDPYRTAYFSLVVDADGNASLKLVEATAADGWHSANDYKEDSVTESSDDKSQN